MSEVKIQSTPAVTDGVQEPLETSNEAAKTFDVNQFSFSRGVEVAASSQITTARTNPNEKAPSDSAERSAGLSVTGIGVTVRPVDRKTVEGSTPGDHRAHPGDVAAGPLAAVSGTAKGPRDAVQQTPNGKNAQ
jgi:hypothetical protein